MEANLWPQIFSLDCPVQSSPQSFWSSWHRQQSSEWPNRHTHTGTRTHTHAHLLIFIPPKCRLNTNRTGVSEFQIERRRKRSRNKSRRGERKLQGERNSLVTHFRCFNLAVVLFFCFFKRVRWDRTRSTVQK